MNTDIPIVPLMCYRRLATAIVEQAAHDYVDALIYLRHRGYTSIDQVTAVNQKTAPVLAAFAECSSDEAFFRSPWIHTIFPIEDPEALIKALKRKAAKGMTVNQKTGAELGRMARS